MTSSELLSIQSAKLCSAVVLPGEGRGRLSVGEPSGLPSRERVRLRLRL